MIMGKDPNPIYMRMKNYLFSKDLTADQEPTFNRFMAEF